MNSLDWEVLNRAAEWLQDGHRAHLFTVVQTWGSAPRLPGAVLAVRDDGHLTGSVSGGCIEDDLVDKARHKELPQTPSLMEYGVSQNEAQRAVCERPGLCADPHARGHRQLAWRERCSQARGRQRGRSQRNAPYIHDAGGRARPRDRERVPHELDPGTFRVGDPAYLRPGSRCSCFITTLCSATRAPSPIRAP